MSKLHKFGSQLSCAPLILASAFGLAAPAHAENDNGWKAGDVVIKLGAAGVLFNSSAKVEIAGTPVPGGDVKVSNDVTAAGEISYFFTPAISAAVNFGIPPKASVAGKGTLAAAGELGHVRYGLGAATVRYHFNDQGTVSPFIGGGVGRLFSFSESDGSVLDLKVDNAWGPVIQGGVDIHLNRQFGLYANVSYSPIDTNASGIIFGMPATADVKLDPTVVQGGVSYRF
jgi:outer membrane protein